LLTSLPIVYDHEKLEEQLAHLYGKGNGDSEPGRLKFLDAEDGENFSVPGLVMPILKEEQPIYYIPKVKLIAAEKAVIKDLISEGCTFFHKTIGNRALKTKEPWTADMVLACKTTKLLNCMYILPETAMSLEDVGEPIDQNMSIKDCVMKYGWGVLKRYALSYSSVAEDRYLTAYGQFCLHDLAKNLPKVQYTINGNDIPVHLDGYVSWLQYYPREYEFDEEATIEELLDEDDDLCCVIIDQIAKKMGFPRLINPADVSQFDETIDEHVEETMEDYLLCLELGHLDEGTEASCSYTSSEHEGSQIELFSNTLTRTYSEVARGIHVPFCTQQEFEMFKELILPNPVLGAVKIDDSLLRTAANTGYSITEILCYFRCPQVFLPTPIVWPISLPDLTIQQAFADSRVLNAEKPILQFDVGILNLKTIHKQWLLSSDTFLRDSILFQDTLDLDRKKHCCAAYIVRYLEKEGFAVDIISTVSTYTDSFIYFGLGLTDLERIADLVKQGLPIVGIFQRIRSAIVIDWEMCTRIGCLTHDNVEAFQITEETPLDSERDITYVSLMTILQSDPSLLKLYSNIYNLRLPGKHIFQSPHMDIGSILCVEEASVESCRQITYIPVELMSHVTAPLDTETLIPVHDHELHSYDSLSSTSSGTEDDYEIPCDLDRDYQLEVQNTVNPIETSNKPYFLQNLGTLSNYIIKWSCLLPEHYFVTDREAFKELIKFSAIVKPLVEMGKITGLHRVFCHHLITTCRATISNWGRTVVNIGRVSVQLHDTEGAQFYKRIQFTTESVAKQSSRRVANSLVIPGDHGEGFDLLIPIDSYAMIEEGITLSKFIHKSTLLHGVIQDVQAGLELAMYLKSEYGDSEVEDC
jgi:hypothetical protein